MRWLIDLSADRCLTYLNRNYAMGEWKKSSFVGIHMGCYFGWTGGTCCGKCFKVQPNSTDSWWTFINGVGESWCFRINWRIARILNIGAVFTDCCWSWCYYEQTANTKTRIEISCTYLDTIISISIFVHITKHST